MATHARQQYFADESSLSKEKREFSIAEEVQQKIDSIEEGAQVNTIEAIKVNGTEVQPDGNKAVNLTIPGVVDSLDSVSSTDALSARQGKVLYDYIQDVSHIGHFLALWDASTGLPVTNPETSPYIYNTGDFYTVSNVAPSGGTNYRPDGTQYVIGQASTTVDTDNVAVNDFYFYDGTTWRHMKNSGAGSIAIDGSLSTTSTNPVENRVITNAINGKQNTLIAGTNIQIAADGKTISATDTTYSAGANISIDANNEISATDTTYTAGANVQISNQNVISATDTKYTAGTGINIDANNVISNTQTSAEWGNITGTLSDQADLQGALNEKQDKLTAGEGIEIGDVLINGRQGPSPDGFHVPSEDDLRGLKTIMSGLNITTGDGRRINLHLPFAGIRNYTDGTATNQTTTGYYASSTPNIVEGYSISVYQLYLNSSTVNTNILNSQGQGFSIRAFKDTFETPTSSWTVINGTLGGAGIFWNQTDGLISITSNGTTGYTIMDKNLGATVVYSDGDTLSEANCGYFYQRGNDYGFPRTGSITTSSTQVDASNYGPSNHYSSNTFITGNVWDSSRNGDLWGDITGTYTQENTITNTGVLSVNGQAGHVIVSDTTYTAGDGINIDQNNEISNTLPGPTIAATAPTGTEGALWYDTTNDVLMAYNGTAWKEAGTQMKVLSYGHSTWQDFIDAYNENAIVYCKASSNSNPGSGTQGRMAFMAFVSINSGTGLPTSAEFQYYRSRSDHKSQANQLDQVFVYTLTSASGGTWSVVERNTATKLLSGTGLSLTYDNSGNMTMAADTTVLATKTDLNSKQDTLVSGTNIKTINSNSLLGSGDLTLNDVKVSATAPSSPTEGMAWYDTTNDVLKVYDGTNWNVTGKEYTAGEGIIMGVIHSDMQGPAPDGFHIPSNDERTAICGILTRTFSMDPNNITMGTYLKMPAAGYRLYSDADVYDVGSDGDYWSSTPSAEGYSYDLDFGSSYIDPQDDSRRSYGFSVRCFKNSFVVPASNWTTLYDGSSITTGAGVFYNATDGLISVSGDGVTGYTIQDKNLGATTVYNYGDTLTDANCGYFYQWGNNYGFAHSGTMATSSTQVDASNYGPGNYYNSSTFITVGTSSYDWSSVQNDNLWGGDSQGTWVSEGDIITNTGVLSINGQAGDVVMQEGIKYNAGEGISIGTYNNYSAMRGPCSEGFHVPSKDDWATLYYAGVNLGIWTSGSGNSGTPVKTYLKMPFAGFLSSSAEIKRQGTFARCWSSTRYSTPDAYSMVAFSNGLGVRDTYSCACGFTIRAFKDKPVIPDNSWTTLYQGTGDAGVFHNPSLGLISISDDGVNWITIQDKNLGATTVYNDGDTLSEANCGKYYQRGNNYGFPRTGAVTTSNTKVNTNGYGPGNYYSSSTFVTVSESPLTWDSSDNYNLRGGVTGVITDAITNTGVLSVNGQTGNITIETFQLAPNSPLTPKYRRYGSQAQYDALTQYYTDEPGDTVYFTI